MALFGRLKGKIIDIEGGLNPTDKTYPYRRDDIYKDSQVRFDLALNIIISSVASLIPWTVVNASTTQTIASHVQRVYATGDITLTFADRGSSGIPITVRNKSGITTLAAAVGTVENDTLTTGQSSTSAFDPIDEVWYEE